MSRFITLTRRMYKTEETEQDSVLAGLQERSPRETVSMPMRVRVEAIDAFSDWYRTDTESFDGSEVVLRGCSGFWVQESPAQIQRLMGLFDAVVPADDINRQIEFPTARVPGFAPPETVVGAWVKPTGAAELDQDFFARMAAELRANAHKGNWHDWQPTRHELAGEIRHHYTKLFNAIVSGADPAEAAADLANLAMKAYGSRERWANEKNADAVGK